MKKTCIVTRVCSSFVFPASNFIYDFLVTYGVIIESIVISLKQFFFAINLISNERE